MSTDPLELLLQIEAAKRSLRRGEHLNPACIESFLANLAEAVVDGPPSTLDYRLQSVRAALLVRFGRVYGIPRSVVAFDLDVCINRILDARSEMIERERRDEIDALERQFEL
jgi:hypothetical protein